MIGEPGTLRRFRLRERERLRPLASASAGCLGAAVATKWMLTRLASRLGSGDSFLGDGLARSGMAVYWSFWFVPGTVFFIFFDDCDVPVA